MSDYLVLKRVNAADLPEDNRSCFVHVDRVFRVDDCWWADEQVDDVVYVETDQLAQELQASWDAARAAMSAEPQWHPFDKNDPTTWPTERGKFWIYYLFALKERRVSWEMGPPTEGPVERSIWADVTHWMPVQTPKAPEE